MADRWEASRSIPDRVDHSIRSPTGGAAPHRLAEVVVTAEVEHLDAVAPGALEALSDDVDRQHRIDRAMAGNPRGHVADQPEPEHQQAPAGRHVGIGDRLPGRRARHGGSPSRDRSARRRHRHSEHWIDRLRVRLVDRQDDHVRHDRLQPEGLLTTTS
jgi:hypothetical protein